MTILNYLLVVVCIADVVETKVLLSKLSVQTIRQHNPIHSSIANLTLVFEMLNNFIRTVPMQESIHLVEVEPT